MDQTNSDNSSTCFSELQHPDKHEGQKENSMAVQLPAMIILKFMKFLFNVHFNHYVLFSKTFKVDQAHVSGDPGPFWPPSIYANGFKTKKRKNLDY